MIAREVRAPDAICLPSSSIVASTIQSAGRRRWARPGASALPRAWHRRTRPALHPHHRGQESRRFIAGQYILGQCRAVSCAGASTPLARRPARSGAWARRSPASTSSSALLGSAASARCTPRTTGRCAATSRSRSCTSASPTDRRARRAHGPRGARDRRASATRRSSPCTTPASPRTAARTSRWAGSRAATSTRSATPMGRSHPTRVVTIAIDVLDALEALHARGVIHRDLKSANIYRRARRAAPAVAARPRLGEGRRRGQR